jgi:endoglucanase
MPKFATRLAAVGVAALLMSGLVASPASAASGTTTVTPGTIRTASPGTIYKGGLYVETWGAAATAAKNLSARGATTEAAAARTIAAQPVAIWLSGYYSNSELVALINRNIVAAEKLGTTPVFVTYNIPGRDCGSYSAGGAKTDAEYLRWNQLVADTLRGHRAVVLVEPDSLGHLSTCPEQIPTREATLKSAVTAFYNASIPAYLDGGNSNWVKAPVMAERLRASGISKARGFYTNVANYRTEAQEKAYAENLSKLSGDNVHYIIDNSRNGTGWKGTWCNAPGSGLGRTPRVALNGTKIDAFLWVKTPGASDGPCNGGPGPGKWYGTYAVDLVKNRAY